MIPSTFQEQAAAEALDLSTLPLIRAANFHMTPRSREKAIEAEMQRWSQAFSSVNEDELDAYLSSGQWHKPKPGLIIALYNGYRDCFDVMLPLLERYGFVGWFFIPTAFASEPAARQKDFVGSRTLKIIPGEYSDGRYALNWDEIKLLDRKHVIACHTRNHAKIANDPAYLENEIVGPQRDFEQRLGHRVRSFAWLSGSPYGDEPAADRLIDTAGYQFIFSNYTIQKMRPAAIAAAPHSRSTSEGKHT